jgi:hypothetical protein
MSKLIPAPGSWTQPCDLWALRDFWGYSNHMMSVNHKALAAAVRVCLTVAPDFKIHDMAIKKGYALH